MNETDLGSCPVAGFGISSFESSGCATTVLVNSVQYEVYKYSVVYFARTDLYLQ
jgi:hypothetical protein